MASLMRAVALMGAYNATVIDVPKPTIVNGTDAIIRMTASAICGSDLHYYHSNEGSPENPVRVGHEAIGYIEEIGDAVEYLNVGDYVVVPFLMDNGHYQFGPESGGASDGRIGMQAEYARIPYADHTMIPVPLNASSDKSTVYDYLFMSDIFATGWTALDFAGLETGDTVAIFGAGPVGQMAVDLAMLRGASKVYSIDRVQNRLDMAASNGAIPINFADSDPVEQILALEPGGVTRVVDAVGFEAVDAEGNVDSSIVLRNAQRLVAPLGGIGVIGVYGLNQNQTEAFNINQLWFNGFSVRGGVAQPLRLANEMANLIATGRAHPSFVVSASIGIEDAPEYYGRFDRKEETKVVIDFPL
ncbi:GroES-like protein [Hypoxylon cercidicola]|nr:GroES-like protein [Hypoxylon cercidicola]